ncbi:MAG: hypothetical protein LBE84_08740 [Planctomycetota bacterium]|jgi:hypothetical protein|nr:hypothetical protein [Planctomycetota bacterium]
MTATEREAEGGWAEGPAFLDNLVRRAMTAIEERFLFRKIGLPFDYAAERDNFPSPNLATAREARSLVPNPSGLGGGYHFSCRNHALLFDAYLLRLELGIEGEGDEAILDRLIGGLIRLATVAPRSFLVGGLSPDGRGFFAWPSRENHAAWTFAIMRGMTTAAIAQETQDKFHSIACKWLDRLRRERFILSGVDGKPVPGAGRPLSSPDPDNGPFHLAMLLAGARASGLPADYDAYAAAAAESGGARLSGFSGEEAAPTFFWRQASLHLMASFDPDPGRSAKAARLLAANAELAADRLEKWREWDPALAGVKPDLDWRHFSRAPLSEKGLGFAPPESWRRLAGEDRAAEALYAMHALLLSGSPETIQAHAETMAECLSQPFWPDMTQLTAIAPIPGIHARGTETGLWDQDLFASKRMPPASETSFAAKFLDPDYDRLNADKSGHDVPSRPEAGEPGGRRKRGRKRR